MEVPQMMINELGPTAIIHAALSGHPKELIVKSIIERDKVIKGKKCIDRKVWFTCRTCGWVSNQENITIIS